MTEKHFMIISNVLRILTSSVADTLKITMHDGKAFYDNIGCLRDSDIERRSYIVNYNA